MTTTSNKTPKKHPNQKELWEIWNNNRMIWRGKPKPEIEIKKNKKENLDIYDMILITFFGLFFLAPATFNAFKHNDFAPLIMIIVLSVICMILFILFKLIKLIPNAIVNFFRRRTAYAFDGNGVYFKLWRWGNTRLHFIDFQDIEQVICIEYQEQKGRIRLMPRKKIFFKTYSFEIGRTHLYPTLEMVDNAVEVSQKMEKLRQMRTATRI